MDVHSAALAWCAAGCSVVRVATDGSKAPLGQWKHAQAEPAGTRAVDAWFVGGHPGVGVVCGAVSGHLEMLELEGRAVADGTAGQFLSALLEHGLEPIRDRIITGYSETSPTSGIHLFYRVSGGTARGNTKLAQRDTGTGVTPLIETRGEGGFVVVAPSHGPVHPTGAPWRVWTGSPDTITTITADERDALYTVARTFDELPPPTPLPDPIPLDRRQGTPPGADYNERATWDDVLVPAGWTPVHRNATRTHWRRPGKHLGVSAVTGGTSGDYLYVWSTSTTLPAETGLSKWRAYTLLHHDGDFHAAAKALSANGYGQRAPEPQRPVLTVLPGIGGGSNGALAPVVQLAPATTHARTDDAMALALVDTFGTVVRFASPPGRWMRWHAPRWEQCPSDGGPVREHVKQIGRTMPDHDAPDVRHKVHVLSAPGTTNILSQASSDPRIVVRATDLDARPFELNTPGGEVDLRTGQLMPHDPCHLHTRVTVATPDPNADPLPWLTFLAETFAGHPEVPDYLQRLVGYSATGLVREHVLPFCFGDGANGKSAFLETIRLVLGGYAITAPAGFLMTRNYPAHETEIARLSGARFVVCSEVNERDQFDEARVKLLTGGDALTARFMRQDHFTFTPTHHLWLAANHQPAVNAGGPAFWRRLRILPFDNTVPPDRQVQALGEHLARHHGDAVMNWIVTGAMRYLADGLHEPDSVHAATDEYAHDQDSVSRFIEDCCRLGGGDTVRTRVDVVRSAYERWCHGEGVPAVSAKAFTQTLRRAFGVGSYRSHGVRMYVGVWLVDSADLTPDTRPGGQD
jgi:P4 family phage/plasmid primase-like protien